MFWTLLLHTYVDESSRPSKTREFDESLMLDLPEHQFWGVAFSRLVAGRASDAKLFPFSTPNTLAILMCQYATELGLPEIPLPYQLRHTGPSMDFASGARELLAIKRRGRWRSDASLRRYESGGRVTSQLMALSARVRAHAIESSHRIRGMLLGRQAALGFRA